MAATGKDTDETIELDNESSDSQAKPAEKKSKQKDAKSEPNVPNFNRFRKWLFIGIAAGVLLIGGMVYAFVTMPYANIAIATDTDEISTTLDVTFDAAATAVSTDPATVPSVVEKVDKTNSETVPATGERNDGVKATGEVTMSICTASPFDVKTVPAGTGVSTGGKNYITQAKATFAYTYEACEGSKFKFESAAVDIVAQNAGAAYNVQNATFTVAASTATANGSASGGTDDIKKIVTQADIDGATQKLEGKVDDTTKGELEKRLKDKGLIAIEESYTTSSATVTSNIPAGTEADQVTVIRKTTNTMVGAKQSDLDNLITQVVEKEIDTKKQSVLDTGVNNAVYELQNQQDNSSKVLMSMDVKSTVGPDLNDDEIKEAVKGMKAAEAEALIGSYPGVSSVEVTYGPFWVSAIPSDTEKITIVYEK